MNHSRIAEIVEGRPCKKCGSTIRLKNTGRCQECHRLYNNNRYQKPEVKERHKENMRRFHASTDYSKVYYQKNKERLSVKQREVRYGLCKEDLTQMLQQQNDSCDICSSLLTKYCVDHNHTTGQVWGLLCCRCNLLIGMANDSIEILQNAITYLEK